MLQCMRIRFLVTTTLDAQLTLSVKPVPLRQEVKQNDAEVLQDGAHWVPHP